ncbi:MAG TPA: BrnT family toxin [Stellaceae bacterium]
MYNPISFFQAGNIVGFDWDDANREKCRKHGISIETIEDLFGKEIDVRPDVAHSGTEQRFMAVSTDAKNRPIFLVFTLRQRGDSMLIRPISARHMHRQEMERYEKTAPDSKDR